VLKPLAIQTNGSNDILSLNFLLLRIFFLNGKMGLKGPGSSFIDHLGTFTDRPLKIGGLQPGP
jgi:hypothetical protein